MTMAPFLNEQQRRTMTRVFTRVFSFFPLLYRTGRKTRLFFKFLVAITFRLYRRFEPRFKKQKKLFLSLVDSCGSNVSYRKNSRHYMPPATFSFGFNELNELPTILSRPMTFLSLSFSFIFFFILPLSFS